MGLGDADPNGNVIHHLEYLNRVAEDQVVYPIGINIFPIGYSLFPIGCSLFL